MDHTQESVNGIVFSSDRKEILLIKRRDVPVWVLPGGGIDKGETPEKAAIREMEEETGLKVSIKHKIAEYTPICRLARFTYFFECQIEGGSPLAGDETRDIRFFPLQSLPKRIPPPYPDWIEDALHFKKAFFKKKITSVTYFILIKNLIMHPILVIRYLLTKIGIVINSK